MPVNKDIIFNSGFTGCEDRMSILRNATVPRKLGDFEEIEPAEINTDMFVYVDSAGKGKKIKLGNIVDTSASQADWDEEDESSYSYIKNKPDIKLNEELVSLFNVGGIKAGDVFTKGTSLYDIVIAMLSARHDDLPIHFGLLSELPLAWTGEFITTNLTQLENVDLADIMTNGLACNIEGADNQFYVLAIPTSLGIKVSEVIQEGLKLDFRYIKGAVQLINEVTGEPTDVWDVCLPTKKTYPDEEEDVEYARTTGTYTVTYKFKNVKESN